jgi:site-specific recombinase XerD
VADLSEQHLQACYRLFRRKFPNEAGSVRVVATFLFEHGWVQRSAAPQPSRADIHLNAFMTHLRDARGYAPSTIRRQVDLAAEFLDWLNFENAPQRLSSLSLEDIEGFVRRLGKRLGRVAMQKPIAAMRNFLRFLAAGGVVAPGLDGQIDTPRVYRQEQLPRALPWPTVQAFLRSINRDLALGKRDYAMFSLMATYGLRACDVVALTLDDIQWRARRIRICQSKTGEPLELPLTDEVGSAIYDYLRKVPRYGGFRHLFLRLKAPAGILKSTAVTEAFQAWSKRSGLDIPFKGVHCIRHSYALHLLHHGLPLKTIGDLLGHRSPESTATYLRLATEDLREVALHVPTATKQRKEGRP